ncbi:FmdB family zinc ribbon protein [Algisphaera agarilytica]|uniref:Putative FmdB family regulatory protein n=1 Tax=Algisphaera agarilytica TaxID=1385975 RepID=A0A7X0H8S9_9BACT|nr:zinc ribbon domain-containing protein [Algisphaera agarilytica]MBB6431389.1 putative FmdB family regulatory protein [Algisphaera agarilytica]
MPTYDYVCDACDHAFEEFQLMTAEVLKKCPACGKMKLRRLIGTGAGVIFKGAGFYETDYRSDSYQKDAKADKPSETKSDSKSSDSEKSKSQSTDGKPKTDSTSQSSSLSGKKSNKNKSVD